MRTKRIGVILAAAGLAADYDGRVQGILVNTCHRKDMCDFYFPGIIHRENLVMGFSSGGQDHRKIKEIREKAENIFDQD